MNDSLFVDETYIVANSVAADAVVGIGKTTLSAPHLWSVTVVVVWFAVTVNDPVAFILPSITPRMTSF